MSSSLDLTAAELLEKLRQTEEKLRQTEEQRRLAEEQRRLAEEQRHLAEEQRHLAEEQRRLAEENAVEERQRAEKLEGKLARAKRKREAEEVSFLFNFLSLDPGLKPAPKKRGRFTRAYSRISPPPFKAPTNLPVQLFAL